MISMQITNYRLHLSLVQGVPDIRKHSLPSGHEWRKLPLMTQSPVLATDVLHVDVMDESLRVDRSSGPLRNA